MLTPDPDVMETLGARRPSRELIADYPYHVVDRLVRHREVTIALFELRLESARRPEGAELIGSWWRQAYATDIEFNESAGIPGGARGRERAGAAAAGGPALLGWGAGSW